MRSELIVNVTPTHISTALLEDGRLASLQQESRESSYAVGNLYIAKVKKLMPGLNAAFVGVGYEKDAFLHYLDLGSQFSTYSQVLAKALKNTRQVPDISAIKLQPDIDKHGTIAETLTLGQKLIVQVVKEPISTKGPRLTTDISFTGRFLVLMPFGNKVSISQKIKSAEEKYRLRQIIESVKPKNFSVIVRTSAEGKKAAELMSELRQLESSWETALAKAQRLDAPSLIYEEDSRAVSLIRDIFSPSFESIHVNNADIYEQIHAYVSLIAGQKASDIVKLYTDDTPIFDHFNITKQIKSSFGKTVSFKNGAYLIIESTEALHVVDVNSGNRTKSSATQESNALEVNLRAADEIARQLRLRDMGGIIVIDYIDMAQADHRQALYEHMREVMAADRARHNILPLSKFGLMQITRQRVRPALDIVTSESCPSCHGKGQVQPSLLFTNTLKDKIDYLVNHLNTKKFKMYVHPFVDAYIKQGLLSEYVRWRMEYGFGVKVIPDQSLAYLEYKVIGPDGNEIDLKEEKDTSSGVAKKERRRKAQKDDDA